MVPSLSIPVDGSSAGLSDALAVATLEFVAPHQLEDYLTVARRLYDRGKRDFKLRASDADLPLAHELRARLAEHFRDVNCALEIDSAIAAATHPQAANRDAVFLVHSCADTLSATLMEYINVPISIVAPITEHYFRRRAVYMITVPKSGTHLLFELLGAFNLINGGQGRSALSPQHYYSLSGVHSHTEARVFFDGLAELPRGGSDHPLFATPTVFIYRNPLDIVISEAHYLKDGSKTSRGHYFSTFGLDERLLRLISGDFALQSLRDRMGKFIPWLHLPNVIPVSFEELVGPQGGGSFVEQLKTIWSLQLKLHIPGSPAYYAASVFRRESKTFRNGAINSHRQHFSEACYAALRELDQDFMQELGYDLNDDFLSGYVPRFVDRFRHRRLVLGNAGTSLAKPHASAKSEELLPNTVYECHGYLAASLGRIYCAWPLSAPRPVDPRLTMGQAHFHVASTWPELSTRLAADSLVPGDPYPRIVHGLSLRDLFKLDPNPPVLIEAGVCGFNIVEFNGQYYCVDHGRGAIDVQWDDTAGMFAAGTIDEARDYCRANAEHTAAIVPAACPMSVPRLIEEGRRGFNIVEFRGTFFALSQSLGPIDVAGIDQAWLAGRPNHEALASPILADLLRHIDAISESAASPELKTQRWPRRTGR